MEAIQEIFSRAVEQLLGRASGPFHLRLFIQPLVAAILAFWAGLKDAREGRPAFLWAVSTRPAERGRLLSSGWKDVGKMFIAGLVLDAVYQLAVFRAFYVVQALIVAGVLANLPYALLRGLFNRIITRTSRP